MLESMGPGRWLRSEKRIPAAAGPDQDGTGTATLRPGDPIQFRIIVIPNDRDPADRAKVLDIPGGRAGTAPPPPAVIETNGSLRPAELSSSCVENPS